MIYIIYIYTPNAADSLWLHVISIIKDCTYSCTSVYTIALMLVILYTINMFQAYWVFFANTFFAFLKTITRYPGNADHIKCCIKR